MFVVQLKRENNSTENRYEESSTLGQWLSNYIPWTPRELYRCASEATEWKGLGAKRYESGFCPSTTVRTPLILPLEFSTKILKINLKTIAIGNQRREEVWYVLWFLRWTLKTR